MPYDRDFRAGRRGGGRGADYRRHPLARPAHPEDEARRRGERRGRPGERGHPDEFEFGDGYVGGRGYGGTNYDLTHGYRTGGFAPHRPSGDPAGAIPHPRRSGGSTRGGYEFSEYEFTGGSYGPARYGHGPYYDRLRRRRRGDDEIRRDVEDALFRDTWVDAERIRVEVRDGVVTLDGTLADFQEIRFANDDAWEVDGVRGVRSRLDVEDYDPERARAEAAPAREGGARRATQGAEAPVDAEGAQKRRAERKRGRIHES